MVLAGYVDLNSAPRNEEYNPVKEWRCQRASQERGAEDKDMTLFSA